MERLLEREIIVSSGKRPFWQTIIAALLYTATICLLYKIIYYFSILWIRVALQYVKISLITFLGALNFSVIKTLYINFDKEKLKTEFSVAFIKVNYFSEIPNLEYVSVFKKSQTDVYEVNLWYKGNKHFNVANFEEFQPAFDFGVMFSKKINIDLLDATEKGNSKWIETEKLPKPS